MKYLIRSIKYFFYFILLTSVIIFALVLIGAVGGSIEEIFEDGYNSLWKIAVFFVAIAAIYPKFAFIRRKLEINADWDTVRREAEGYFRERGLKIETESADVVTFRRVGIGKRIAKMNEDRITVSKEVDGYYIDGLRKDVILFATALEYRISPNEE